MAYRPGLVIIVISSQGLRCLLVISFTFLVLIRFQSRLIAQPGTIVFIDGLSCVPGQCGDNSTTFDIVVGNLTLQRLDTQNTSLKYVGRFPNFQHTSPGAPIQIVTQYQTFRLGVFITFTLNMPLPITAVMPSRGQRGTNVTITGSNLVGPGLMVAISRVRLGDSDADIIDASSSTTIRVRARSGTPGNATVRINTTDTFENVMYNGSYLTSVDGWFQLADGSITDIVPPAAQLGRSVLMCGVNLLGGGTSIAAIQHGTSTLFQLLSPPSPSVPPQPGTECIEAQIPLAVQDVNENVITVSSDTGSTVVSASNFTISSIVSISPGRGQAGTIVTIRGQGLLSGYTNVTPTVFLANVLARLIRSNNNEIVARTGTPTTGATQIFGVMGSIVIEVPNPLSANTVFNVSNETGWQYEEVGVIDSAFPDFGQSGTVISITGSNLLAYGNSLTHATIDGINATILDGATNSLVQLVVPDSNTIGFVDVILYSDTGASVRGLDTFEYRGRGVIMSVQPNQGQGGTLGKKIFM